MSYPRGSAGSPRLCRDTRLPMDALEASPPPGLLPCLPWPLLLAQGGKSKCCCHPIRSAVSSTRPAIPRARSPIPSATPAIPVARLNIPKTRPSIPTIRHFQCRNFRPQCHDFHSQGQTHHPQGQTCHSQGRNFHPKGQTCYAVPDLPFPVPDLPSLGADLPSPVSHLPSQVSHLPSQGSQQIPSARPSIPSARAAPQCHTCHPQCPTCHPQDLSQHPGLTAGSCQLAAAGWGMLCEATRARCRCQKDMAGEGWDGLSSSPSSRAAGSPPGQGPHPPAPNERAGDLT